MSEEKGGNNDFLWALLVVFIILGALMAASIWFPYYPEGMPEEDRVIHTFSAGVLGYTQNYVSRVQDYGDFGVGVPQDEEMMSAPRMEISAGVFGGQGETFTVTVPDYVEEWLKGGTITFTVDESNEYGNLIVRWNGAEVYKGKPRGEREIELLPSQVKKDNTLEIVAEGPGLMFWAATVYEIKDLVVNARYGPAKFLDFEVSQDELQTLDHFELAWYTVSRRGNLSVSINGEEIYMGYPDRDMSLTFTDNTLKSSIIKPGNNRIMLSAINGSFELSDVIANTYVSRAQRVIKERVDISDEQLKMLQARGGVLRLYVKSVEREGRITLSINEQTAGSGEGQAGWNALKLNTDLLIAGANWLEISSTGGFDISEAKVEVS